MSGSSIGNLVGGAFGGPLGAAAGGLIGGKILGDGKKKANANASMIVPEKIKTGRSTYNSRTGETTLDSSIRRIQDQSLKNIQGFAPDINNAYDKYSTGLEGIQTGVNDLRSSFEGNQSAYRDSMLNPIRQAVAQREGALDRELNRTNVRGSFRNQAKTNLALDSARTISDAEAKIENDRINKLGDFLNMDADILKQGLASDTGRVNMLQKLEESLQGISMDRFNQEMQLLKLPAAFMSGQGQAANIRANAQGVKDQFTLDAFGNVVSAVGDAFESSGFTFGDPESHQSNFNQDEMFWE